MIVNFLRRCWQAIPSGIVCLARNLCPVRVYCFCHGDSEYAEHHHENGP